jgi:hypothetical protein
MKRVNKIEDELTNAERVWGQLSESAKKALLSLIARYDLSVAAGDLLYFDARWYVTHSGLLGLANRRRCAGIAVSPVKAFCNPQTSHWAFKATVFRSRNCKGFVGYGDADPSNVAALVSGAELRVAETRAVNRALRKAYGIGICSVEEIGTAAWHLSANENKTIGPSKANGTDWNSGPKIRDWLCQVIRQHRLDPNLVKAYAIDFCGTETLKEATREQVEEFVRRLSDWAQKDRNALLCQLNSYSSHSEGAA